MQQASPDSLRAVLDSVFRSPAYDWRPDDAALSTVVRWWQALIAWIGGLRDASPLLYRALFAPDRYYGVPVVTRAFVAAARAQGCPVHVWTVDDPAAARRLWSLGAAGMITNVPREIRAARAELG